MSALGELLRSARKERQWTLERLATQVTMNKQRLSAIERGEALPTIDQLIKLYEVLATEHDQKIVWLLQWLAGQVQKRELGKATAPFQEAIEGAVVQFTQTTATWSPGRFRSLADFPAAFQPLTIICGDRRELRPRSRADLFTYSVAITDLMFLEHLGLTARATMIKSDKLFVLMDDDYLHRTFGNTNLLVIGSPAVNHATRLLNQGAVFRFDLDPALHGWEEKLRVALQLNDLRALEVFWDIVQKPKHLASYRQRTIPGLSTEEVEDLITLAEQLVGDDDPKDLITRFRKPGLVDPADGKVHGTYTRQNNDFGVISLALNPFAATADYVCIIAAGIHGPGTAQALKGLGDKNDKNGEGFQERPFGGIIEVDLDQFKDWPTRFETATWKWQTKPYTPQTIVTHLAQALEQKSQGQGPAYAQHMTGEEIQACMAFIRSLMGNIHDEHEHTSWKRRI
jgi:transcriptional regulator with XRE-family HTH domain